MRLVRFSSVILVFFCLIVFQNCGAPQAPNLLPTDSEEPLNNSELISNDGAIKSILPRECTSTHLQRYLNLPLKRTSVTNDPHCEPVNLLGRQLIRCNELSSFSNVEIEQPCENPNQSKILYANGEPQVMEALKKNALSLKLPLSKQIQVWSKAYNDKSTPESQKSIIRALLASAFDQICRQSSERNEKTCRFPFPDLQNARHMMSGQACASTSDQTQAKTIFANNTALTQAFLQSATGRATHIHIQFPLQKQVAMWKKEFSNTTNNIHANNLANLIALGDDQLCRCANVCAPLQEPWKFLSQRGPSRIPSRENSLSIENGNFNNWDQGDSYISPIHSHIFTANHWLVGPGIQAQVEVKKMPVFKSGLPPQLLDHYMRIQWIKPSTGGEMPNSPRFTFLENHRLRNNSVLAGEAFEISFYIRSNKPTTIIPIVWSAFGLDTPVNGFIIDGQHVQVQEEWTHVRQIYRPPSSAKSVINPNSSNYFGIGIDLNTPYYGGFIDVANFQIHRLEKN